jgi:hypothetical protein
MTVLDRDSTNIDQSFNAAKGNTPAPTGRFLGRLLSFNCVSAGALMVRAALRDRFHPIPDFAAWNDWWIATQVLREAEIVAVPESVNLYRRHGANMNLGGDEARAVSLLRTELPFRRWLLANTAPPLVAIADLLGALAALDWALARIAAFDGELSEAATRPATSAAQAAFAAGRDTLCRAEIDRGVVQLIAAIAHAPLWPEPRALLSETLDVLHGGPQSRPSTRAQVEQMPLHLLLAEPSRLQAWVASGDIANTTLVITGVADEAAREAVLGVVSQLGLTDHATADLLAVAESDPATIAVRLGRPLELAR